MRTKILILAIVGASLLGFSSPAQGTPSSTASVQSAGAHASYLPTLGHRDAFRQARSGLRKYYGNKWIYGYKRQIWVFSRLGRTRLRLAYVFNGRQHGGYITVWRSGRGYISSYISPLF